MQITTCERQIARRVRFQGIKFATKDNRMKISLERHALRAFAFVLIPSLKKSSEEWKGLGVFGVIGYIYW